jgi:hypothetical protein
MRVQQAAIRALVVLLGGACAHSAWAQAEPAVGPGQTVVHTRFGGFILGYDIDQAGSEGILSEAVTNADGTHDVAVETFDQRTGEIIKVLRRQRGSNNDYVTFGIFGEHVALTEFEHVSDIFVDKRRYLLSDPIDANEITGKWTPPFNSRAEHIIEGGSVSQGFDTALFWGFKNTANDSHTYLFTSNVGANTFGPEIQMQNPVFDWNNSPKIAHDPKHGQVVLGSSFGCFGCTIGLGFVDLATGEQSVTPALGKGMVNGIALDPNTRIVCTTSEGDFSVEFYDLKQNTRKIVVLPGATSQAQSGGAVAVDPVHRLFLVGQEFSSTAASGSSIHVFDEEGNLVESLDGFDLPASPANMALKPSKRSGFVIVTPDLTSLQSFTY